MAKLRKFCAYRRLERPYTRTSKYRKKSFIRVRPHSKVVKYNMGDPSKKFEMSFDLICKNDLQIRHNAIESARLACNRYLEKNLGKNGFYFEIRIFPHHILRENPLASGAGADRMSTGMKMSFGKPIGVAAQVRIGQTLFTVNVPKKHALVARDALKRASKKLPCKCAVVDKTGFVKKGLVNASKVKVEKKEEPVVEKPKVEEPKAETPKEEAKVEEVKAAPEADVPAEEPKVETPEAEPVVEKQPEEAPVKEESPKEPVEEPKVEA